MSMNIKTGDNVLVISGKEKGKTGKVSAVYPKENKVLVDNINIVTKHRKPRSQQDKGGIVKKSAPFDASNVMVVCPVCGKATRVSHSEVGGKKVRTCKKCNASLDKAFVKASKKEAKKIKSASELKSATLKQADEVKEEKVEKKASTKSTSKAPAKKSTTSKEGSASTKKSTASTKKASK